MLVRNLPRMVWLILVIILPDIGAIAWLALGRPLHAGWRPGDTRVRQRRRVVGPEDRTDWVPAVSRPASPPPVIAPPALAAGEDGIDVAESPAIRERRLMEWEAELQRREAALSEPTESDEPPTDEGREP